MTDENKQPNSQAEHTRLLARRNDKWCKYIALNLYFYFLLDVYNCSTFSDPAEIIHKRFNEECHHDEYYVHYDGCDRRLDQWLPLDQ